MLGQDGRFGAVGLEQVRKDALGLDLHAHDAVMPVHARVEEILQLAVAAMGLLAESDHVVFQFLDIQRGLRAAVLDALIGGVDQVGHLQPDQFADQAMAVQVFEFGSVPLDVTGQQFPERDAVQHARGDHAGAQAVVEIVRGVGQFVARVADLGLQVAAQVGAERRGVRDVIFRFVLDDALAQFPGEIQAGEFGVALLQFGDEAQGLLVVVESAEVLHQAAEGGFAGMSEGRMSHIVNEADCLHQVFICAQRAGDGTSDLRHLERVSQARAIIVAFVVDENLGLVFEAAEGGRVQDAVAVALERSAVLRLFVQVGAAFRVPAAHGVRRKAPVFDLFELLAGVVHGVYFTPL